MKNVTATILVVLILAQALYAGLGSKDAQYMGGTIAGMKDGAEGKLDTASADAAAFVSKKGRFTIPYKGVTSLEYGQKAGRRIGATIGWGVTTMGIAALPMLLSKKRKHYLTVEWTDESGVNQGAVIQLGKDITRGTLTVFQVRSGKEIEYQDEDARKHAGN